MIQNPRVAARLRELMPLVLIVEDNEEERRMYAAMLCYNGFEVLEASDAVDALEIARTRHPDAVVMDYLLPTMSGMAAAEILATTPETSGIPVICITGYSVTADCFSASGCRELMRKPIRTHELILAIQRQLDAKVDAAAVEQLPPK
jgi:two-component system, cell cycle response regulator DivK